MKIEQAINDFIRTSPDLTLVQFLKAYKTSIFSGKISDQENKAVLVLALIGSTALIFDPVEEEFGLARQTSPIETVDNVELIGDLEPSILELFRRTKC